jgi:hydroxymethylglutaryl-CoA lyase
MKVTAQAGSGGSKDARSSGKHREAVPQRADGLPARVTVYDVGPRDGLQNVDTLLAVEVRVRFVEALAEAGLRAIEVGAFVNPRAIPQMVATDQVYARLRRRPGVRYPALVPNEKGLDAALAAGVEEIAVFTAASETFNQRNINTSIAGSLQRFTSVVKRARAAGLRVRGYVSTCFGCPYEGAVDPQVVHRVTRDLFALGVQEVSLGDTIGVGVPTQVEDVAGPLLDEFPVESLALHFHDTRGTALANVLAALRLGLHIFDASAGGLGGCPYAPGAAGNLATEDLIFMLHGMGIETGVDLQKLVDASLVAEAGLGTPLSSRVLRATLAERRRRGAASH